MSVPEAGSRHRSRPAMDSNASGEGVAACPTLESEHDFNSHVGEDTTRASARRAAQRKLALSILALGGVCIIPPAYRNLEQDTELHTLRRASDALTETNISARLQRDLAGLATPGDASADMAKQIEGGRSDL